MMAKVPVQIVIEEEACDLELPRYETEHSAGMDLRAAIEDEITVSPGERCLISTGLRIAVPEGYEAQVRPRSGLAIKQGLTVVNAPGTIDADYRGIVAVGLVNLSAEPVTIHRGDRIAQMIIAPVVQAIWERCKALPETARGEGGFGHTGV